MSNGQFPDRATLVSTLLAHVPEAKKDVLADFLIRLYGVYVDLHCAPYLRPARA